MRTLDRQGMDSCRRNGRQKGSVLVLVLVLLASLVALSAGLGYRTRIEVRLARTAADRVQAFHLARGGVERMRTLLSQQELSPSVVGMICQFSGTADHEQLLTEVSPLAIGRVCLAYSLRDEQAYVHINKSNPAGWERIPGITREDVAAILDWGDADDHTGPGGAETDFYERLKEPYVSKDRPCAALRELLFVKGIDSGRYLGAKAIGWAQEDDKHVPAAMWAVELDGEPGSSLLDVFTVYGDGKINLNTVQPAILAAIPGLDEQSADRLLAYRAGEDRQPGTEDDVFIASAEDLAQVPGLSNLQIEVLSESGCFTSEYFRVFSLAKVGARCECCLMASIRASKGKISVLSVERLF
jgi:type II secretory pathway component PulK